ncbi:hypothetical protein DB30_01538 [Enhygromyxa salina]|uniref:Tetratricopeptide repeat protein n=1 Tax=Enhygromyxa salina TaxID=215803 RepID=A0A0C1Z3W5_9BACT|nr:hypothetical protein [Enhygromyxa salina]KIG12379.1 hypothetical protein DB30_01538 [Enhygromyxa salina]
MSVVQWLVGWFLSDPERPWRALPHAEAAHALMPGLGQAMILADLLTRCQREDDAAQLLEPWLALDPDNPGLLRTAAFALQASRQLESCRYFERYFALDSSAPIEARLAYAGLLTQLDREPEAVELARTARDSEAASRDPLVLLEVARILAAAAPPGRKTRADLRAIHQRLATNYPGHALVERLLVELYFMLGAPTDLPAPDFNRLIAEGVAWGASFDHGVEALRAWAKLRTQAHAAWRAGMFSFAALRRTAAVETADVLERLLVRSSAEPVFVPPFLRPRVAGETPIVAGQLILLGDLEVHLLAELDLWPELLDRLGPDGHVAMFADIWREHVHAAVLRLAARNDRLAHDRVARLRDLLDRTTKLEWVSKPGPHAVVVSNDGPDQDVRWSLEVLLATLAGHGWLLRDELEPLGIDVERQRSELPDHVYLDEGVIEDLWRGEQLENVLRCDAIRRVEVARSTREGIVARVEVHELGAKAVERAKRVRRVMIEALDHGRLEIVERPSVDLPPPAARHWTMFHEIAVELRSWRQFLVERPRALMLSADHATSAGSTRGPVGLAQTLAWTSRDQLERALEAHRGLGERVLDFAELVAELAPPARSFETAIGLVRLGFSAALEPHHILYLGLQHPELGLAAPRAQRVLDQYEWPARTNLDSLASTQFHVCHNYAGAIWLAWCGDAGEREPVPDAFASSFSNALAQRVADLAAEELCQLNWRLFMWLQITAIQSPLYGAVDGNDVPYVGREPSPGDRVLFSGDTPAGRLWAWLGSWIAGHPARARAWNLALQHTVAFCAGWRHDYMFVRDAIASLRLAVAIVGGSDEPQLARPPLCHLVLLAFTCDQPREVLTMHQFASPVSGQHYSWWDVLQGASANDIDSLRHGVASASLEDGMLSLSAEVPTALLASEPSPRRSEALIAWAHAVAPFDARLATAAVRLAEVGEPGDREAFVRVHAESPARSADDDPLGPSGWGLAGDVTFPKNLEEVVQLLGEDQPRTSVHAAVPTAWRLGRSCLSPFEGGRRPPPELSERARAWLAAPTGELSSTLMFAAAVSVVAELDGPPATPADSAAQLLARALEAERAAAEQRETATTAQLEWRLLGLAKTVIVRLSQDRRDELPAQRVLELSWSLFWWWWRRLHLIPEPARAAAFDCLIRRAEPTELERASEGFVLDPDRFGPGKWNHRLAGLLAGAHFGHELASQFADHQPDMFASASLEAELVALLALEPTPAERAERRRGQTAPSPLGWLHDVSIRDLALALLLETQPGAFSRVPRLQRNSLIRRSFSRGRGRLTPDLRRAVLRAAIRDNHLPTLQWAFLRSSCGRALGRPAYMARRYATRRYATRRYRDRRYSVLDRAGRSSS